MSALKGTGLDGTFRRSAALALALRTLRYQRRVVRSNWLKTIVPPYSRTEVGPPGSATVTADAAAGIAATASASVPATAAHTRTHRTAKEPIRAPCRLTALPTSVLSPLDHGRTRSAEQPTAC